jgi:iron complex outermembrane receptor protein
MRARDRTRKGAVKLAVAVSNLLRSASLCVPFAIGAASAAMAQSVESARLSVDIPAQPLAQALAAFADQTSLQIVYVSDLVRDKSSESVSAGTRVREALSRLLRETGLKFEYLTPRSIRILGIAAPTIEPISFVSEEMIDDIIVTANRRNQDLQNVPITVQVLTGATLSNLNVKTFDDFVSYLPGVTAHGVGPEQNSIYVRGLATTEFPNEASGTNGVFPNVAIYLDEQSAQLPGRNLDIYAADLERIEVLEGPQGTLFGAGAEAGAIRYITNKPKLNVTEGSADAGYSTTAHGAPSSAVTAVINIPLIDDALAVRGVIYNDRRGGYIDNIPATFARSASDASIAYANYPVGCGANSLSPGPPCKVPPNSPVINNANIVARAINPVSYQGIRIQALYQFNDSWSALLAQSYQSMEADGVFVETVADSLGVPQPHLTTQLFNPSYNKDRFKNTALTVNGRLGTVDVVYAGAFSVRNVEQVQDYTNYARAGAFADYYQCVNPRQTAATAQCFSPSSTWRNGERNTHQSHEFRVTTSAERRIRGVGGLFYEDYRIQDQGDWFYLTALPYFNPIAPPTGYYLLAGRVLSGQEAYQADAAGTPATFMTGTVTSNNPNVRTLGDAFFNDTARGYQQKAAFASVDWDLVPGSVSLTTGSRYFRSDSSEVGSTVGSYGCSLIYAPVPYPCVNRQSTDLDALGLKRSYSGFRSRASLSWKVSDAAMVYTAWSQGFRAGGFNRGFQVASNSPLVAGPGSWQAQASQNHGWTEPLAYAPDNLTNTEVGWRSNWRGGRLQWNGTLYQEDWTHAQVSAAGVEFGGTGAVVNGGTYQVRGIETSVRLKVTRGFTVDAGAAWNQGRLVKEAVYYWANGTPINFSTLQDEYGNKAANFGGVIGSPLAAAPPFQGNIRARYEIALGALQTFFQVGAVHQAHSLSSTTIATVDAQGKAAVYDLAPFTTLAAALGVGKDGWSVQAYGENLSDTRAQLFANYNNFVKAVTVNRPRTIGLRIIYKFGGG